MDENKGEATATMADGSNVVVERLTKEFADLKKALAPVAAAVGVTIGEMTVDDQVKAFATKLLRASLVPVANRRQAYRMRNLLRYSLRHAREVNDQLNGLETGSIGSDGDFN